jgi:signal transduction histidine kinase/DNA-binding response OmpR family regulator
MIPISSAQHGDRGLGMPDYLQLFQSFQSLHQFAERDKNLIFRSIQALALENRNPISHIESDIINTYDLDELLICLHDPKKQELHIIESSPSKHPQNHISLKKTAFEQAPLHQKVLVVSHLTKTWLIDGENHDYQQVLWVPICAAGQFIGAIISRSVDNRQDLGLIGEALLIVASTLGYHLKNEELQDKLKKEKEKAMELARIKSDFLSMMSHELRTPLNGVIGMTELLKEGELDHQQEEYANIILNSGESLLSLINDILDYSKMDAGKMILDKVDFQPVKLAQEISSIFRHRLRNSPVDFIATFDENIPHQLLGDPGRIKQIINNLLGNAFKFTSKGHIHFSLKRTDHHLKDSNQIFLRFEIEDTGIGIARKNLETIFESFAQENSEISKKYGGTGLGLAITNKLTNLMGGEIEVESTLGKGTTFIAEIPFELGKSQQQQLEYKFRSLHNLKVLVVDDNPNVTLSIQHLLENLGITTYLAHSAEEAFELIAHSEENQNKLDAVITDRVMNHMDGFEFAKNLSQSPHTNDIPVVMMTSRGLRGDAQKAHDVGLSAFITKPIRKELLKKVLQVVTATDFSPGKELITKYSFEGQENEFKILVVDDNRINHKVIHNILSDEGYIHDFALHGKEAIQLCEKTNYDLIFMDINMPIMDGIEATGYLRTSLQHYRETPIVALTAKRLSDSDTDYQEMGFNHFLAKPFKRDQFMQVVLKYNPPKPLAD